MEKKIEDYLNLYLGCKCKHPADAVSFRLTGINPKHALLRGDWSGGTHNVDQSSWVSFDEFRLILRRLSSMTEEEIKEFDATKEFRLVTTVHQIGNMHWTPETFRWLLSKSFDIFGLIDSNLAIDAKP